MPRVLETTLPLVAGVLPIVLMGCGGDGPSPPSPAPAVPDCSTGCSPEICSIDGENQIVQLQAGTYCIDRQVFLPKGTTLRGAGVGKTFIKAIGEPLDRNSKCLGVLSCRRGFILNDNTFIGGFTYTGRDKGRWGDNELLYGGAPIETPGCTDSYCNTTGLLSPTATLCTANDCAGIDNATAEDIYVTPFSVQIVVMAQETPEGKPVSSNLIFNRLATDGTWADGLNIHGAHHDVLVSNCIFRYTSDDGFAIWSNLDMETNVVFENNTIEYPRWDNNYLDRGDGDNFPVQHDCANNGNPYRTKGTWGVNCFAMYGGGSGNKFLNNKCTSTYWAFLAMHAGDKFKGIFNPSVTVTLIGNTITTPPVEKTGPSCCVDCPFCYWVTNKTSKWQEGMQPRIAGDQCVPAQRVQGVPAQRAQGEDVKAERPGKVAIV